MGEWDKNSSERDRWRDRARAKITPDLPGTLGPLVTDKVFVFALLLELYYNFNYEYYSCK